MARKEPAKGIHTSPSNAGVKNLPKTYVDKNKDELGTMEKILPVYKHGMERAKDYKGLWDEESLLTEIDNYFTYCAEVDLKPAKVGLGLWLGISKSQYWEWETKPEKYEYKSNLIKMANDAIESSYMARLERYPTGNIFLLKSVHGHSETTNINVNSTGTNAEEIAEAISKLGLDK